MTKPRSIRTALLLFYLNMCLTLFNIITYLMDSESFAKYGRAPLIIMVLVILFTLMVVRFVNRNKRMPAILLAMVAFVFTSMISIQELVVGMVALFLLMTPSARTYFLGEYSPQPGQARMAAKEVGEAADGADADAEAADPIDEADTLPAPRVRVDPEVEIRAATPEDAETVHSLMMSAFEEFRAAVPPSSALDETVESVREALRGGEGAFILYEDGNPAAMVRYGINEDVITFFRLSVLPSRRRRGYAKRLVKWIEQFGIGRGLNVCRCKVRQTAQKNVNMYQDMGYEIVDQELVVRETGTVKALTMEKKLGV